MTTAIAGGTYAKRPLISYASYEGVPDSNIMLNAERLAARAINAAEPDNRTLLLMAGTVCPVLKYAELHGKNDKLAFQMRREACALPGRLGRLCSRRDYAPFQDKLIFEPCDERAWRGVQLPFTFVPMPVMGEDGHYRRGGWKVDILCT
ncbi:hypothetical protein CYMTET_13304 [Cymbomonas tetramitiformis]|uniref:Uncharacterized protein n=1 Tax=Cymbomonas tetramitiformis TaxID=36881 RepID=A0AAE0GJX6_9CHLO|nr:hypothetical protein CYMTET_13304 [Cymbomonas tetramitiformis]